MQLHGEDAVQVTWLWDRTEYSRLAGQHRADQNRVSTVLALVSATVTAWMFYLWDEGLAWPFPFGAVWLGLLTVIFAGDAALTAWLMVRNTPDVKYAPMTILVDVLGVRLTTGSGEVFFHWSGLSQVVRLEHFWKFVAAGVGEVAVPRRLITPADDAALAAVVDRYAHRVGRPDDVPPPAEV
ncbi:hypothetical protein [Catellatospora sichuanensis]|uniref:hypothetical protein n=1 Tax=Catellatospora sichuanensis TaxID=1969805 RepID=UPI0016435068|nr:hypothetical protein [Catellatospora sichuanensis]